MCVSCFCLLQPDVAVLLGDVVHDVHEDHEVDEVGVAHVYLYLPRDVAFDQDAVLGQNLPQAVVHEVHDVAPDLDLPQDVVHDVHDVVLEP